MRRTARRVSSSEPSGGDDEIGAGALLRVGELAGEDSLELLRGHAGTARGPARAAPRAAPRRRRSCRPAPSRPLRTGAGCRGRPAAPQHARPGRPRARRATAGWIRASSRRSASGSPSTRSASAPRLTPPGPVVPGKCASISLDQRAFRALQPVHGGVGVEHRHAFVGEHPGHGGLAHADRAGEAEGDHRAEQLAQARRRCRGGGSAPKKWPNASAAWPISIDRPSTRRDPAARARLSERRFDRVRRRCRRRVAPRRQGRRGSTGSGGKPVMPERAGVDQQAAARPRTGLGRAANGDPSQIAASRSTARPRLRRSG